jgi:hypothetical protein
MAFILGISLWLGGCGSSFEKKALLFCNAFNMLGSTL